MDVSPPQKMESLWENHRFFDGFSPILQWNHVRKIMMSWLFDGLFSIQWIGLGENLQESPMIFMGKSMVSG